MSETPVLEFTVQAEEEGLRLDTFLVRRTKGWSRSQIQRLIRSGQVMHGNATARKAGELVQPGDRILAIAAHEPSRAEPEALPLTLVYEDADLAVVDKPAGMTVHLGAGARSGTLVNALLHHFGAQLSSLGGEARPGIVHRLDKMTSGLILIAKNNAAHRLLAAQFKSRQVHKTYHLLVHGRLTPAEGAIHLPIGRDPRRRVRMKVRGLRAREALTEYRVLGSNDRFTLVEAYPRTGRTHQLRVHFAWLGHPIVGDTLYGAPRVAQLGIEKLEPARIFLHAAALQFRHPTTGQIMSFTSSLPDDLQNLLSRVSLALSPKEIHFKEKETL